MATKLYFRNTSNSLSNLPITEQSSLTSNLDGESQTINRTLSTIKGTSETSLVLSSNGTTSAQNYYFSRFVSEPLGASSISANTWTYGFAATQSSSNANFPVTGTDQPVRVNCYVWRPSTSAKVGTILDGNTASTVDEVTANTKVSHVVTFTGAAVASLQSGDVLIFEVWFIIQQGSTLSFTDTFYYDGTTAPTENATSEASVASYIETPQDALFVPPSINMTNVSTTGYTNKFIIKV